VSARIALYGFAEARAAFDGAPRLIEAELTESGTALLDRAVQTLTTYPAERERQTYVRTGNLKDGWLQPGPVWQVGQTGISFSLTNTVPYAQWVEGDQQAWMHAGRWPLVADAEAQLRADAEIEFGHALDRAAARINETTR